MSDTPWQTLSGGLAARRMGSGRRVVFLHGFTQTATSWQPIAAAIADHGFESVVVDLPGHGASAAVRADLRSGADLLSAFGPAIYVGYSMGGRFALQTAITHPTSVEAVALLGATPGIDDEGERAMRRAADARLAEHIAEVGLEEFLSTWLDQALFGALQLTDADRAERMTNTVDGLASSLRLAGTGSQLSLWHRLGELTMPVLSMAGALDSKFAAIATQVAGAVREGRCVLVPEAAHAAHLQQPEWFVSVLLDWLRSQSPSMFQRPVGPAR